MSAIEKIQVELSPFEKLQILRSELDDRQKELAGLEAEIRSKLQVSQTQRYLESLSPYYAANPREGLASREEVEAMEARRVQLHELIRNIEATIPMLLQSKGQDAGRQAAPAAAPAAPGPVRKARFDSFDDFAQAKRG